MNPEDRNAALNIRETVRALAASAETSAARELYLRWLRELEAALKVDEPPPQQGDRPG